MMIEKLLVDAINDGDRFDSAQDFYDKRVRDHSYLVLGEGDTPEQKQSAIEMIRKSDMAEIEKLQLKYFYTWSRQ